VVATKGNFKYQHKKKKISMASNCCKLKTDHSLSAKI
jgi:hypothetical protein